MNSISPLAHIDPTAKLGEGIVIEAGAWVGPGTEIGDKTIVQANAVVGRGHVPGSNGPTILGRDCIIASGVVVYHDVMLHDGAKVWHNAVIMRHVTIGAGTSIGVHTCIVNDVIIGRDCSIHGHCQVGDFSQIGDFVFIGPGFLSVSDHNMVFRRPQLTKHFQGIIVHDKARIGGRVLALPGSVVGEEAVVGAGSVIKGELVARVIYMGDPIRPVRKVKPEEFLPDS